MPERRPTVCALLKSYDGDNLLPVFLKFTRASPVPNRPAWGTPPPYTRDPRCSRDPEEGNNEEICLRGPASSGASGSTAFDPDPLTPQPEVTVPQAGTGHSGFAGNYRDSEEKTRFGI